jgi:rRNA processing protein Gar1
VGAALMAAGITAGVSAQRGGGQREDLSAYLPPGGAGREKVAKECSACHDLSGVIKMRKDKAGWEAIVLDMVGRGAPLMIDDVDPIVGYLAEVFGPGAPPFIDVSSATKEDLAKLPGVTPEAADKLIAERAKGPIASHEQVRTALGLDEAAFAKLKAYIYIKSAAQGSSGG